MLTNKNSVKGFLAIVVASFLWGTTGVAASLFNKVSPFAIGAFATGVAGVLLMVTNIQPLIKDSERLLRNKLMLVLGALCITIYPLAFYRAMQLSGVAIGTIVSIATAPMFAAILERLFSKKAISNRWIVSFALGAIGIVLLTLGKEYQVHLSSSVFQQTIGVSLGGIAGLSYACYSWLAKRLIEHGVHSRSAMSGMFGLASLLLLPSLLFTGDNLFASTMNISIVLYMALVPMFIGYLLFAYGMKFVSSSEATLITLLEPLIATILAVQLLNERFSVIGWLGASLIFICLIIQSVKPKQAVSVLSNLNSG